MNYQDELMLTINTIWQSLDRAGKRKEADSVAAAADSAKTTTELMAAADHAQWHMQELEKQAFDQMNQYDRDCY